MKSYTPGTFIVFTGMVLLIIVSVSVPILKSVYFLQAAAPGLDGVVTLGVWGYCIGGKCSNTTLGYDLNVDQLFGVSGLAASSGLSASLIKGLTYALVLHPIAAAFAFLSFVFGLISHIRELPMIGTTTTFASLGSTFALVAFVFDIVIFEIARQRIVAAGGSATLGNAIWITLVGMLCLLFSDIFFCIGRCVVRKQRTGREASEKNRPQVDPHYGAAMRSDAIGGGFGASPMYGKGNDKKESGLPQFEDSAGEIIPLTALGRSRDDDEEDSYAEHEFSRPTISGGDNVSLVSGVGYGYGARVDNGIPVSLSYDPRQNQQAYTPGLAGAGANGLRFGESRSTVAPFESMQSRPALHQSASTPSQYLPHGNEYDERTPLDEYGQRAAIAGASNQYRHSGNDAYGYPSDQKLLADHDEPRPYQPAGFAGPSQHLDSNYYAPPNGAPPLPTHPSNLHSNNEDYYLPSPTTPINETGAVSPSAYSQDTSYPSHAAPSYITNTNTQYAPPPHPPQGYQY